MPYLQNEKTRTQAEIQTAETDVANLTTEAQGQQQTITQAQTQANTARSGLAGLQAQRPGLEAAAAAADQALAGIDRQIVEHQQNEPDRTIERPNKPPLPNPEWTVWKRRLDTLTQQRNQVQASASAAHNRLNALNGAIAQAAAEVQSAETRAAQAAATLAQLNGTIAAARERAVAAHQRLDDLTRLSGEIDRDPMDRGALERVAAGLSARVIELEDAYRAAAAASAAAAATLASLLARRDQLTAALTDANNRMPAADAEAAAADSAVRWLAQQIDHHLANRPQ
jgi:golgin subfamily B member 1